MRDDLNTRAPRVLCVLRPLRVVLTNYPEGETESLEAPYWPHDVPQEGSRRVPFSRDLYIDRDDFAEEPPKGFFRLAPGREVRLRYGYVIRCEEVVNDPVSGQVIELRCSYDPATRGGATPDGRKVRGTIHWVAAETSVPVEVRLYGRLFRVERPDLADAPLEELVDPDSVEVLPSARIEPAAAAAAAGARFQFERHGYFFVDPVDSAPGRPVFHRVVPLRDTWSRGAAAETAPAAQPPALPAGPPPGERPGGAEAQLEARPRPLSPAAAERFDRYREGLGLSEQDARLLAEETALGELLDEAVAAGAGAREAANWIANDLVALLREADRERPPFAGDAVAELAELVASGHISASQGKEVLAAMVAGEGGPAAIVEARGLEQVSDRATLVRVVEAVVAEHPEEAAAYRAGKTALAGFFIGRVMARTAGRANPRLADELVRDRLAAR